jgi:hypothetical protein
MMMISMKWICGSGRPHRIFTNQRNRLLFPDGIKPPKTHYVKKKVLVNKVGDYFYTKFQLLPPGNIKIAIITYLILGMIFKLMAKIISCVWFQTFALEWHYKVTQTADLVQYDCLTADTRCRLLYLELYETEWVIHDLTIKILLPWRHYVWDRTNVFTAPPKTELAFDISNFTKIHPEKCCCKKFITLRLFYFLLRRLHDTHTDI